MRFLLAAIVAATTGIGSSAWAYEESPVTEGGTLVGTVTLEGKVPRPKGYNLITLPDQIYCGRISDGRGWRLLQPFNVGGCGSVPRRSGVSRKHRERKILLARADSANRSQGLPIHSLYDRGA